MSATTAVVHLVRAANGMDPFLAFMASYERHAAGREHDLVLLLKGFAGPAATAPYVRRARDASTVSVPDDGLDLTAYRRAAAELRHERLCFLNSYSEILADGWLAHLSAALDRPGVGAAGATGSWGSHRSFALSLLRVVPHGYGDALGDRAAMAPAFRSVGRERELSRARQLLKAAWDIPREIAGYDGFPAPHLRTNAFLVGRRTLLDLRAGRLGSKAAAHRFEGGRRGLTGQLRAAGREVVAVGAGGAVVAPEDWPGAELFWQGAQRDLLVGDNQTRAYADGGPEVREALSRYAWGPRARWA